MSVVMRLHGAIQRVQAIPDRHLAGLYGILALVTTLAARVNVPASGWVIVVAFFSVGAVRALKHPTFADTLFAFVIGMAAGAGAATVLRTFDPAVVSPRSGVILASFGGLAFTYASVIVAPIVQMVTERALANHADVCA